MDDSLDQSLEHDSLDKPPKRSGRGDLDDDLDQAPPRRGGGKGDLDGGLDPPRRIIRNSGGGGLDDNSGGFRDRNRHGGGSLDDDDDLDPSKLKEPPIKRSTSQELENSFSLCGIDDAKSWKHLDTVHKKTTVHDPFGDSDSLMEDSFAGSSFASTADSSFGDMEDKAKTAFQTLDDEPRTRAAEPRRRTPARTYSKNKPKPLDTLVAISETDDEKEASDEEGLD